MELRHRMTPGLTIVLVVTAILNTLTFASSPENYGTDSLITDLRDPVRLDDVVVKANRLPFTLMEIPAAASVKHTGSAVKSRFASAGDLIGSLPGFRAYPIGNVWGKSQVDVRGFGQ